MTLVARKKSSNVEVIPFKKGVPGQGKIILISDIVADPKKNARFEIEESTREFQEFLASIRLHGVLEPPLVRELPNGDYELSAGYRRVHAAKLAGILEVRCVVLKMTDLEHAEFNLVENVQREDLLPAEVAFACARIRDMARAANKKFDTKEIARKISLSSEYVANLVKCADNLIADIAKAFRAGFLPVNEAIRFSSMEAKFQKTAWALYRKSRGLAPEEGEESDASVDPDSDDAPEEKKEKTRMRGRAAVEELYADLRHAEEIWVKSDWMSLDDDTREAARSLLKWILGIRKKMPLKLPAERAEIDV